MKIGMVAQSISRSSGGVGEAIQRYCEAIAARNEGHDIHVFAAQDRFSHVDSARFDGLATVHIARSYGMRRFPIAPSLARLMQAANLDLLHVHGVWAAHGGASLAWYRRTHRPMIVAPHGMLEPWILKRSPRLKAVVSKLFQDDLLRCAARVHALTKSEGRDIQTLYPTVKIDVLPNLVPPAPAPDGLRPDWWQSDYEGRKIFLFFGRIHKKKGVVELIEAWVRLSAAQSAFRKNALLVFCGWVDDFPDFEAKIGAANARSHNILYAGPQYGSGKWSSFAAANYMLLPSKSEGLPLAILEAWSAGVPTIMSDECNLPIGFSSGAAIRCPPIVDGISHALQVASLDSAELYANRVGAARDVIATAFSPEKVGTALIELYQSLFPILDKTQDTSAFQT